jgi:hypothetical protein
MELHRLEWNAVVRLLGQQRGMLSAKDTTISGWAGSWGENLGLNSGEAAGQTVFHAHWRLIPGRGGGVMSQECGEGSDD